MAAADMGLFKCLNSLPLHWRVAFFSVLELFFVLFLPGNAITFIAAHFFGHGEGPVRGERVDEERLFDERALVLDAVAFGG